MRGATGGTLEVSEDPPSSPRKARMAMLQRGRGAAQARTGLARGVAVARVHADDAEQRGAIRQQRQRRLVRALARPRVVLGRRDERKERPRYAVRVLAVDRHGRAVA